MRDAQTALTVDQPQYAYMARVYAAKVVWYSVVHMSKSTPA